MQFSTIISILAVAFTANAAVIVEERTGSTGAACTNNQKSVCCQGIGAITCLVNVLGSTCGGSSYCCETNSPVGAVVNINALNCVKVG